MCPLIVSVCGGGNKPSVVFVGGGFCEQQGTRSELGSGFQDLLAAEQWRGIHRGLHEEHRGGQQGEARRPWARDPRNSTPRHPGTSGSGLAVCSTQICSLSASHGPWTWGWIRGHLSSSSLGTAPASNWSPNHRDRDSVGSLSNF